MKKKSTHAKSETTHGSDVNCIKEFHLFAGIGGGIYGGRLLHHKCVGAVEIMPYARGVLAQRKKDGWMDKSMDIDSHVVQESEAPIVFGENVVLRAIEKARCDLEGVGYKVERIRLSCEDLGADHRRNRFWLLAIRDDTKGAQAFQSLSSQIARLPKLAGDCWTKSPAETGEAVTVKPCDRRDQLLGVGNAQSPFVAASAFRILVNRHLNHVEGRSEHVSAGELDAVFEKRKTWIDRTYRETGIINGLVHTPTTMANYACPSMMKHEGCRNFAEVFERPEPENAEYLMGFPLGASSPNPQPKANIERWG